MDVVKVSCAKCDAYMSPYFFLLRIVTSFCPFKKFNSRTFFPGLFSTIMRDLATINNDSPKWIVLDGDIDPMWIESLNTVMDDNKVTKCVPCWARVLQHP